MKLTGRTRYRMHKPTFGKPLLVLQVEVQNSWTCWQTFDERSYTEWRDATVEDVKLEVAV